MNSFNYWKEKFDNNDLLDFSRTAEGLLWLKLRSIDRKDLLTEFCTSVGFHPAGRITAESIWQGLSSDTAFENSLEKFMLQCQKRENATINNSLETIRSNLYSMTHFHWGGGFRNSLDKAIVSRYVKTENIIPFDQLERICDGELREMSRGYLLNSWYNYWSSVLIENLFRRNPNVLPALGKIKKLKVYARRHGIVTTSDATPEQLRYEIVERMKDSKNPEAQSVLDAIDAGWRKIVECIMAEKGALIRWLYENQGDMRFGTENRVFLILIDMLNPDDSWKLKRNVDMISPLISNWVSGFKKRKANDYLVEFSYKSRCYETYADIIFVIKKDY